jgi:hypothetical protein
MNGTGARKSRVQGFLPPTVYWNGTLLARFSITTIES